MDDESASKPLLPQRLQNKYDRLCGIIREAQSAVVAFSGGVDSTLLFKVCVDFLKDQALAVTARSETYPVRELEEAKSLARRLGGRHLVVVSEELDVPGFADNPANRCFLCKSELYSKVKEIAKMHGMRQVFDGNNADDAGDFRPGRRAAKQHGVRSPLEEARLTKKEIRTLSRIFQLPTWNKPAFACLASRFPYHSRITRSALRQVEAAENILRDLGLREFRVRHHDTVARVELGQKEMQRFWQENLREGIVCQFKSLGYTYVTLDLEGYRTGSMNETLSEGPEPGRTGKGKRQ